ncbi:carbohydrate-binding domain-containing protein [Dactylosporangium sp. NPDC051541]|uniref:carbohydrate-binding domain-containing protein n=1 Tax=Dactylosporangium sp. NPDC051541 TaxID=3363977 RepID=UPI00378ED646
MVGRRIASVAAMAVVALAALGLAASPAAAENAPNGYPYCNNGSASDPDGDGWGWENNQSCVVRGSRADPNAGSGGGGSSSACPSGLRCGSYSVSGLGSRKQQVLNAGADTLDLAIAMLETENMGTGYAYGDNKTGDAANFGIFKQNWLMLRQACSRFQGQSTSSWNNGSALNSNLSADVQCLNQSQSYYGIDRFFAGHRNGSSGLSNPNTSDIQRYKTAVYWIRDQINSNSANRSNNTRFWVEVPAI